MTPPSSAPASSAPRRAVAGETLDWLVRPPAGRTPADGFTCAVTLKGAPGGAEGQRGADAEALTVAAIAYNGAFRVTVADTESASLGDGRVTWTAMATKVGEGTFCVGRGEFRLEPLDGVSQNERTLAAIDAVLAGRGGADLDEYTVGDRHIKKIPLAELRTLRGVFARRVARERRGNKPAHYGFEALPRGYPTLGERRGYGSGW